MHEVIQYDFFLTDMNENLISRKRKKISTFRKKPLKAFALQIVHLEKKFITPTKIGPQVI